MPIKLAAIGKHHRITTTDAWIIMTPRHQPQSSLQGHLTFALKYEGLDLAVLKRLFLAYVRVSREKFAASTGR